MNKIIAYNFCKQCGTQACMPGYTLCKSCLKDNAQDIASLPLYDWEGQRFETNQEPGRTASLQQKIVKLATKLYAASQYDAAKELILIAIGEASMCWDPRPSGTFKSTEALAVGEKLLEDLNRIW